MNVCRFRPNGFLTVRYVFFSMILTLGSTQISKRLVCNMGQVSKGCAMKFTLKLSSVYLLMLIYQIDNWVLGEKHSRKCLHKMFCFQHRKHFRLSRPEFKTSKRWEVENLLFNRVSTQFHFFRYLSHLTVLKFTLVRFAFLVEKFREKKYYFPFKKVHHF